MTHSFDMQGCDVICTFEHIYSYFVEEKVLLFSTIFFLDLSFFYSSILFILRTSLHYCVTCSRLCLIFVLSIPSRRFMIVDVSLTLFRVLLYSVYLCLPIQLS